MAPKITAERKDELMDLAIYLNGLSTNEFRRTYRELPFTTRLELAHLMGRS